MSNLEVTKEVVIDSKVVEEIAKIAELIFYSPKGDEDDASSRLVYITRKDKVIGTIGVGADACQNTGYINYLEIKQC